MNTNYLNSAGSPLDFAAAVKVEIQNGRDPQSVLLQVEKALLTVGAGGWLAQARAFLQVGLPPVAVPILNQALKKWPNEWELAYWLAKSLHEAGDLVNAEAVYRDFLRVTPESVHGRWGLAALLNELGRYREVAAMVEPLAMELGDTESVLRAVTFMEHERVIAWRLLKAILEKSQADPLILRAAGETAVALGKFEEGRSLLRQALDEGLDVNEFRGIWLLLANTRKFANEEDGDIARMRIPWESTTLSDSARAAAGFSLGKAYDDLGLFEKATEYFRAANAIEHDHLKWSVTPVRGRLAEARETSYAKAWSELPGNIRPIFIVGLPRTGTTLLAELLGRHEGIANRGELTGVQFLSRQLTREQKANPVVMRKASLAYLAHLRRDDAPVTWYIDKNPHNFMYLRFISALLPGALVIHCRRDRRDTALSIWSQLFAGEGMGYAYDFNDIIQFSELHDTEIARWEAEPELASTSVDYEALVADPEATIQRLLNFIGNAGATMPVTKIQGAIVTASLWQARQSISRTSVGKWQSYLEFLPELASLKTQSAFSGTS